MTTEFTPQKTLQRHVDFDFIASTHLLEKLDPFSLGHEVTGREDFLSLLEAQLGMNAPKFVERLLDCERYLQQILTSEHLVFKSFEQNPISSSQVLLKWFDGLTLIGWRGEPLHEEDDSTGRLERFAPMNALYQTAQQDNSILLWSEGLRLERCCDALQENKLQITSIHVQQPIALLPHAWQRLFMKLRDTGVKVSESEQASLNGFNAKALQQQLAVVSCKGQLTASRICAQLLLATKDKWTQSANLLVSSDGALTDQALQQAGLPSVGFQMKQKARYLAQIILAIVTLCSTKYSLQSLVTLLTHPAWPGNKKLAKAALKALTNSQGFDSTKWREAADAIAADNEQHGSWLGFFEQPKEAQATDVLNEMLCAIKAKSHSKAFMLSQQGDNIASSAYAALAYELDTLINLVKQNISIDRLPFYIKELGLGDFDVPVGKGTVVDGLRLQGMLEPGQLAVQPKLTCWVGPYFRPISVLPDWYRTEQQALAERFSYYAQTAELELQQHAWACFAQQTLNNPKQRIVIIHYDQQQITHPLYDQFMQEGGLQLRNWSNVNQQQVLDWINDTKTTTEYPYTPLYAHARGVQLNNAIGFSKQMSASRFEKLIFKPSDFVLNYLAKVRDGQLEVEGVNNKLKGSYAHVVFEHFFREHPTPSQWNDTSHWFDNNADMLLKQYALVYAEPGATYEASSMKEISKRALMNLVSMFTKAGAVRVHPEFGLQDAALTIAEQQFELTGSIDFLVEIERDSQKHYLVLDAKLNSSESSGKQKELEDGIALQLYFYAAAVHALFGQWPAFGFFVISRCEYLMADTAAELLSNATRVRTPEPVALRWKKFTQLAKWRFEQFARGELEINDLRSDQLKGLSEPENEELAAIISAYFKQNQQSFAKEQQRDIYSDYRYLTGWRTAGEQEV